MLLRWMTRRGYQPKVMSAIGIPLFLVAMGVSTIGIQMNRALDRGTETLLGIPLSEPLIVVLLVFGSVLMGTSIVFNVVGINARWKQR